MKTMFYYQIAGLKVASEYCLDYAFEISAMEKADVYVYCESEPIGILATIKEKADSRKAFVYKYDRNQAFYGYPECGVFYVKDGKEITFWAEPGIDTTWVIQTLLCQCFGAIISQRRMIGIHGSVCMWKNKAFIVCGESGAGKSTLTANLLQRGAKYMADDTACVDVKESIQVRSMVPLRKLCVDTMEKFDYSREQLVALPETYKIGVREPERFHLGTESLSIIFYLKKNDVEEVQYRELQGVEKLKVVTGNLYAMGGYEQPMKEPDFAQKMFAFCNQVPIYEIVRPSSGDSADRCVQVVEEIINKYE